MRGRAVGFLIFAAIALAAPATASAADRIKPGSYQGVANGTEITFDLNYDGGVARIENFEMFGHSCGRHCRLLRMLVADVKERKASFIGTGGDESSGGLLLIQVELNWRPNGHEVDGTWTVLSANGGAISSNTRPLQASFQHDGGTQRDDPGTGDPGAQGGAASASPLAGAAASRPEYVSQLDPICQSYEKPATKLVAAFFKQTAGVLEAQETTSAAKIERRLLGPFGRLLGGANKLIGKMTAQMAGVPAPTGDEATITSWLESRRAYRRIADRAVQAGKKRKVAQLFGLLAKAGSKIEAGDKQVTGFGFQQCLLS